MTDITEQTPTEQISTEQTPETNLDSNIESDDDLNLESHLESDLESSSDSALKKIHETHQVTIEQVGMRLDKISATVFGEFSRAQLQEWILASDLTVNGEAQKSKYRVRTDDQLELKTELTEHRADIPENIPLDIVYEDDDVVVVNKPVGMVVHPGAGNWTGTLVNALLFHYPEQSHLPRAGLVHRIDKDTSGLLIVAKNKVAQLDLTDQLKDKSVYRHYQCVVAGNSADLRRQKTIDLPIGRHKTQRTKMAVTNRGKDAVTHLLKITPLTNNYSLLDVSLETGRTHQIRVHLSHLKFPLVGDNSYGQRQQIRAGLTEEQRDFLYKFSRQALHAHKLGFVHPSTGEDIQLTSPLPDDMVQLIEMLKD